MTSTTQNQYVVIVTIGDSICETKSPTEHSANITDKRGGFVWQPTAALDPFFDINEYLVKPGLVSPNV